MFQVIEKLDEHHFHQLMDLYQQCWWAKNRSIEDVKKSLTNCLVFGLVNDSNDLLGFSRVLTDSVFKALIMDVVIDEKFRKKNLGHSLFNSIVTHPKIKDIKHVELVCTDEMIPFYEKWGFTEKFDNLYFMRKTHV